MSPCFPCGFSPDRGDISLSTNTGQNLGNSCCSFLQKQQLNALLNVIFHFGSCLQPTPVLQQTPPRQSCTFLSAANFQSAFQGQGGFHAPHAMKTLLDPERHNTEGVFRNQGGCQHLCRQKVHPSTNYLNALGLQSLPCVTRSGQGADGCALGGCWEQENRAPQDLLKGDSQQLLCAC